MNIKKRFKNFIHLSDRQQEQDSFQTSHSKRLDRFEEIQLSKAEREVAKDMLKALRMVRKGKR